MAKRLRCLSRRPEQLIVSSHMLRKSADNSAISTYLPPGVSGAASAGRPSTRFVIILAGFVKVASPGLPSGLLRRAAPCSLREQQGLSPSAKENPSCRGSCPGADGWGKLQKQVPTRSEFRVEPQWNENKRPHLRGEQDGIGRSLPILVQQSR